MNMSTDAILFFKKDNGKYDGVIVNFDGYIRCVNRRGFKPSYIEGLGWTLNNYWDCYDDAKKLCASKTNIRSINGDDIDFYSDSCKDLKNLSKKAMEKHRQNYCYSYIYQYSDERNQYNWIAGRAGYQGMFYLNNFFEEPDEYSDEDSWWNCFG